MGHRRKMILVICFKEKDREVIEKKWITIVEFKRQIYNEQKNIDGIWKIIKKWNDEISKAFNKLIERCKEAVDEVELVYEQIREAYHYTTSRRYRMVKIFSKCTGTDIRFGWKIAYKVKKWLARDCC